ncbi:hypothetical protein DFAR_4010007 [Desulfarculales bacterium]
MVCPQDAADVFLPLHQARRLALVISPPESWPPRASWPQAWPTRSTTPWPSWWRRPAGCRT